MNKKRVTVTLEAPLWDAAREWAAELGHAGVNDLMKTKLRENLVANGKLPRKEAKPNDD